MADKEITDLTAAAKLDGTETIHGVQGGNSREIGTEAIAALGATIVVDGATSRVPTASDAGKWVRFTNSGAITCTFNTGVFTAGDEIMFEQGNTGVITYTAGAGFTLRSAGSLLDSNGQDSVQGIKFISATDAVLFGSLA